MNQMNALRAWCAPLFKRVAAWWRGRVEAVRSGTFRRDLALWWRAERWVLAISFGLAIFVFYGVRERLTGVTTRSLRVDVEVEGANAPDVAVEPRIVRVSFRGTNRQVLDFDATVKGVLIKVKADELKTGRLERAIKPKRDVPGLKGLGIVVDVKPGRVRLTRDIRDTFKFQIRPPQFAGSPDHGDAVIVNMEPPSASLTGGRNLLSSLNEEKDFALVLPAIDVDGRKPGFVSEHDYELALPEAYRDRLKGVKIEPTHATVTVAIKARTNTRRIDGLPVRLSLPLGVSLPKGFAIRPSRVEAQVSGPDDAVASLSASNILAHVFVPSAATLNLAPGATNTLQIRLEVPADRGFTEVVSKPGAVSLVLPAPPPPPATNAPPAMTPPVDVVATNAPPVDVAPLNAARASASVTNAPAAAPLPLAERKTTADAEAPAADNEKPLEKKGTTDGGQGK